MLEQRRAQQKGYITLKEAASLAGYTPDYIGQLIRAGKIKGQQVYSGVAWMTTEEEIQAYKTAQQKGVPASSRQAVPSERYRYSIPFLGERSTLLLFVVLFGTAILLMQYAIYVALTGERAFGVETRNTEIALHEDV